MKRAVAALVLAALLAVPLCAVAQSDADDFTNQEPKTIVASGNLRDPEFRVESGKLGLKRDVEMLQWMREEGAYVKRWRATHVSDEGFDAQHRNPPMPKLRTATWLAAEPRIDGKAVEPAVLMALGQWIQIRPSFSRVPYRWSRQFEPDGDGLSNSENPLEPEIGDVRITWSEMFVPTLERQVVLANGIWQLPENLKLDFATREALIRQSEKEETKLTLNQFLFRLWGWAALALFAGLLIVRYLRIANRKSPIANRKSQIVGLPAIGEVNGLDQTVTECAGLQCLPRSLVHPNSRITIHDLRLAICEFTRLPAAPPRPGLRAAHGGPCRR